MATKFIGFNTQGQFKKFTLTNESLIRRDFLNALNIRQGELIGRPEYGTILWGFLFEPQSTETVQAIQTEIQRVAALDPRIFINNTEVFSQLNGILIQIDVSFVSGVSSELLSIFFDQQSLSAKFV